MKKFKVSLSLFLVAALLLAFAPACSNKVGCPANEDLSAKQDKKGNYPKGKTSSGLFPKKMKKKVGVN